MNPYTPPKAELEISPIIITNKRAGYAIAVATLLQFGFVAFFANVYVSLTGQNSVPFYVFVLSIMSSILLYSGAIRFSINGLKGRRSLLLAGIGLGYISLKWNLSYMFAYPFVFGSVIGLIGWWIARRNQLITRLANVNG